MKQVFQIDPDGGRELSIPPPRSAHNYVIQRVPSRIW